MNSDCDVASVEFLSVRRSQGAGVSEPLSTGVGVRAALFSLVITLVGSRGTSPVPQKPPC